MTEEQHDSAAADVPQSVWTWILVGALAFALCAGLAWLSAAQREGPGVVTMDVECCYCGKSVGPVNTFSHSLRGFPRLCHRSCFWKANPIPPPPNPRSY